MESWCGDYNLTRRLLSQEQQDPLSNRFLNRSAVFTVDKDGNVTITGTVGCGGGAPFHAPDTNYGVATNATSTPVWFKAGLQASTTAQFVYRLNILPYPAIHISVRYHQELGTAQQSPQRVWRNNVDRYLERKRGIGVLHRFGRDGL